MSCTNCPNNCLGNEISMRCIYDEDTGKSLISILSEIRKGQTKSSGSSKQIYSDDILSKSLMRNTSYICSAQIVKREFEYELSLTESGALFSWDLLGVSQDLPEGFKLATSRVKITGNTLSGSNVLADSKTLSGGVSLNAANFPVSADITMRVTSPCGDVELTWEILLTNPTYVGKFRSSLDVKDLNPQTGGINLTQQLNSLESQLSSSILKLNTYKELIDELRLEIESLKEAINS